ncbi:MAG TPA: protein-glutamate O-methyltransferase CheR [bacterium]|nr:protein-glutamate O-methyltransferase CheR [bacterium]HOL46800.1 protein-glutamate O-methyltransferase CheR [bacterium]HPQ17755.1 protein-glutamate O-methyltransferase CheR [bacterium]
MILSYDNFKKLQELIYRRTGLFFEDKKLFFIKRRVELLMKEENIYDFDEYFRIIKFYDFDGQKFQKLINAITTNETYFFREFDQLKVFAECCLPEILEKKSKINSNLLRIWSAACSSGEEVYTLAIIILEMIDDINKWKIELIGTDIDKRVLKQAIEGKYNERSVKFIPPTYFDRYIYKSADNKYCVSNVLKEFTYFEHLNFFDDEKMSQMRNFDVIFCRNALIYFDEDSRRQVVNHFYNSLNPGGYIFLGHSESMSRITNAFNYKKLYDQIVYYKPEK